MGDKTVDLEQSESRNRQRERYLRVLKSGSVREKALMIANHLFDARAGEKTFLTQEEINAIARSINSDKDIAIYEAYKKMVTKIDTFLMIIAQCKYSYLIALYELDRLLVMMQKDKDMERIINKILHHVQDADTKRKIISEIDTDGELYLKYGIYSNIIMSHYINNKDLRLEVANNIPKHINTNLETVKTQQARLKTAIKAIKDFMDEKKFKLNEISRFIKRTETWIKKDKSELLILKAHKPNAQDIKEPDYNTAEINNTLYKNYTEGFLNG